MIWYDRYMILSLTICLVVGFAVFIAGIAFRNIGVMLIGIVILVLTVIASRLEADAHPAASDHQHALRVVREVRAPCVAHPRVVPALDAPARVVLPACADLHALNARRDRRDV
jgi:cell division protein FtsW (lipid II flippase)